MKREFVASYLPSLQPRLAQGVNEFISSRLILRSECLCHVIQREFWIYPENFCSFSTGLILTAHQAVCSRELHMGRNIIRRKLNCFLICRNRLLKPPRIPECGGEVAIQNRLAHRGES